METVRKYIQINIYIVCFSDDNVKSLGHFLGYLELDKQERTNFNHVTQVYCEGYTGIKWIKDAIIYKYEQNNSKKITKLTRSTAILDNGQQIRNIS